MLYLPFFMRSLNLSGRVFQILMILLVCPMAVAGPLHDAAESGDLELIRTLLSEGAAIHDRDENGNTALHFAALNGHAKLTAFLLDAGTPIDVTNRFGVTPLMLAEYHDHYDLAKWLVLHGADPNMQASDSSTVLSEAWKKDRWDFVQFLFLHGVDPNAPIDYYVGEAPPLVAAAWDGEFDMVKWLLQHGVDVKAVNNLGMNSIHEAVRRGNLEIVRLLLKHGTDVNPRTTVSGTTALHAAVAGQDIDMVRVLIKNGADVNAQSTSDEVEWRTPFTLALDIAKRHRRSDDQIVALLLRHGAKVPKKLPSPESVTPTVCHSEMEVQKLNGFLVRDRMARYIESEARLFVEIVYFWEYGEVEPIDHALYDSAVVWSLERVLGLHLAPLSLFNGGCAINRDTGFIVLSRVNDYKRILNLIAEKADSSTLRAALLDLANRLRTEQDGVFQIHLEVGPEEVVSEFEKRIQRYLE